VNLNSQKDTKNIGSRTLVVRLFLDLPGEAHPTFATFPFPAILTHVS